MKKRTITRKGGVLITTKKYVVKSIGFDKETHNPLITRFDIIDLINNPRFNMVSNEFEIEDKFESFWNRLNPIESSWYYKNIEIVKVLEVLPFKEFKMKYPKDYGKTKIIISKSSGFTNPTINNNE